MYFIYPSHLFYYTEKLLRKQLEENTAQEQQFNL